MPDNLILSMLFWLFLFVLVLLVFFIMMVIFVRLIQSNSKFRALFFRFLNKISIPLAGSKFTLLALLRHTGRRSGKTYQTPMRAYPFGDGLALGLTYGPGVDWCRNVLLAGTCVVKWRGKEYIMNNPEIIPMTQVLSHYPLLMRLGMARVVKQCLWVHKQDSSLSVVP
jgi:hypothetical protein